MRPRAPIRTTDASSEFTKPGDPPDTSASARPARTYVVMAIAIVGIALSAFVLLKGMVGGSAADEGLEHLYASFGEKRPLESRISDFGYAEFQQTRGENQGPEGFPDETGILILKAAASNPDNPKALHAVGKYYLSKHEYEKANSSFEQTARIDPDNSQLQSDWGASLLEMSKNAVDGVRRLELLDQSLARFDKALTLAPRMPEALFNRSLCLQYFPAAHQSIKSWNEFLEVDDSSEWAREARENLKTIDATVSREKSAEELEAEFLDAVARQDKGEAAQLIGRNRELIREKYLPQKLAMSFVAADEANRARYLEALKFAGELEFSRSGDGFARDLAAFYVNLSDPEKREILKKAHEAVRSGNKSSLNDRYREGIAFFENAQKLFTDAGNIWEAKLAEYSMSYCLINDKAVDKALEILTQIVIFAEQKEYKWLTLTAQFWIAGGLSRQQKLTESKRIYEKTSALAREIGDDYSLQRNLLSLATHSYFVGRRRQALKYLNEVLVMANAPETSLRQKQRNYTEALPILLAAGLNAAAKPVSIEAVQLADGLESPGLKVLARSNAGFACAKAGEMAEAEAWLDDAEKTSAEITDKTAHKDARAYALLRRGFYERKNGNLQKSADAYSTSADLYMDIERPFTAYAAMKGKIRAHADLGNEAELEVEIPKVIQFAEVYRSQIFTEQERGSFFDTEDSIYEMAVGQAIRINNPEKAYNYSEGGSSRALLDWLQKGARNTGPQDPTGIELDEKAVPLDLSQIRARIPDGAQIVQYAVLEDRLVIWVISRSRFEMVPVAINSADLRTRVESFLESIKKGGNSDAAGKIEVAKELYDLLIAPVEAHLDPTKQVCLIPSKFLFHLPFAALVSRDGNSLLSKFVLSYSPSASVFIDSTENAAGKSATKGETVLSIGNPAFDRTAFDKFADLPHADKEALYISGLYDKSKTFVNERAEKQQVMASLKNADVLHFAGHYVVAHDAPLMSFLLLARNGANPDNSMLTNAELGAQKLPRAKLIVLSACDTGSESYTNGEGMIGLSRTFMAVGAPLVVASQWAVESKATAALMKRFHFFRRKDGLSTAAALRKAQLEMAEEPDGRNTDPYYWAAFGVFGGYSTY